MMHSIDRTGRIVCVNDAWLRNLGYERDEVVGRKSTSFLAGESRAYAESVALPRFFEAGEAREVPFTYVKKNGETMDLLLTAVSERNTRGNFVRSVAVLIDVIAHGRAVDRHAFRKRLEHRSGIRLCDSSVSEILTRFNTLTPREVQVMELVFDGMSNKQMAKSLGLSPKTVDVYRDRLKQKMRVKSVAELVRMAIVCGVGNIP